MATTRWRDNETRDLGHAIELLTDEIVEDERITGIMRKNWSIVQAFSVNKNISLFGDEIEYNVILFSYDRIINDDNIVPQTGFIIVYKSKDTIKYIIDKKSEALLLLRKMLSYKGKNEVTDYAVNLSNDFFYWIINRVFYSNNTIERPDGSDQVLRFESIKGFSGDTEDAQTKVTASGESVMNIISTLAFFLESSSFKKILIELRYKEHENIMLILKNGTIEVDKKCYLGPFEQDEENERIAKLYLMCYIEILPILLQEYETDKENGVWNDEQYLEFLNDVSQKIMNKINDRRHEMNLGVSNDKES